MNDDGIFISGELSLANAKMHLMHRIVCESSNAFFSLSSGSGIRGFTPFRFSVEPVDTLAVRGLPAVLNCSAASDAPVRVEWKKDGTFLNLVADDRKRQLADGSLLISTVVHSKHNKPDEGVYQCVATIDNLGTISSRTARLTVAGMKTKPLSLCS